MSLGQTEARARRRNVTVMGGRSEAAFAAISAALNVFECVKKKKSTDFLEC